MAEKTAAAASEEKGKSATKKMEKSALISAGEAVLGASSKLMGSMGKAGASFKKGTAE